MWKFFLISSIALFTPVFASAALTIDATTTATCAYPNTNCSATLTVGTCDNRLLIFTGHTSSQNITLSGTFNSTSSSKIAEVKGSNNWDHAAIFALSNPDSGTHNVVFTTSGADHNAVNAVSFCGASSTGAIATSTTLGLTLSGASDSYFVDGLAQDSFSPGAATAPAIKIASGCFDTYQCYGASYSTSTSFNWATGGTNKAHVGVEITAYSAPVAPLVLGNITSYEFVFVITCLIFIWIALLLTGKKVGKMIANIPHARL